MPAVRVEQAECLMETDPFGKEDQLIVPVPRNDSYSRLHYSIQRCHATCRGLTCFTSLQSRNGEDKWCRRSIQVETRLGLHLDDH